MLADYRYQPLHIRSCTTLDRAGVIALWETVFPDDPPHNAPAIEPGLSPGLSHDQPSPEDQMLDPLLRHAENLDSYTELRSHANLHTRW